MSIDRTADVPFQQPSGAIEVNSLAWPEAWPTTPLAHSLQIIRISRMSITSQNRGQEPVVVASVTARGPFGVRAYPIALFAFITVACTLEEHRTEAELAHQRQPVEVSTCDDSQCPICPGSAFSASCPLGGTSGSDACARATVTALPCPNDCCRGYIVIESPGQPTQVLKPPDGMACGGQGTESMAGSAQCAACGDQQCPLAEGDDNHHALFLQQSTLLRGHPLLMGTHQSRLLTQPAGNPLCWLKRMLKLLRRGDDVADCANDVRRGTQNAVRGSRAALSSVDEVSRVIGSCVRAQAKTKQIRALAQTALDEARRVKFNIASAERCVDGGLERALVPKGTRYGDWRELMELQDDAFNLSRLAGIEEHRILHNQCATAADLRALDEMKDTMLGLIDKIKDKVAALNDATTFATARYGDDCMIWSRTGR